LKTVKELGEREIIDIILKCLESMPDMQVPFGDDVSAFDIGRGKLAVIKTDMLVGRTDVPSGMSLWQAARKAVVMNISDFAAKGVKPIGLLTSIGVPRNFTASDIKQIGEGLNAGAREYGAYIVGGDTNEASDLIISCVVFGVGKQKQLMLRRGAKPGDIVAITGVFGKTAAGLKVLLQKFSVESRLKKTLVEAVLMPHARLEEGLALARTGAVTASIDSSDGLAWSLCEISKASDVGFLIDEIPIAEEAKEFAERHGLSPFELCFYGGEEYELVVTVNPKLWEKARKAVSLIRIGMVTKERTLVLEKEGERIPIEPRGWEHFKMN